MVAGVVFVDVDLAEGAKGVGGDVGERIEEAGIGGDDTDEFAAIGAGEMAGVGDLAAEVEAAGEGEDVGEREAFAVEGAGEGEGRGAVEEELGASAADFGGGKEEEALHGWSDRTGRGGFGKEERKSPPEGRAWKGAGGSRVAMFKRCRF